MRWIPSNTTHVFYTKTRPPGLGTERGERKKCLPVEREDRKERDDDDDELID